MFLFCHCIILINIIEQILNKIHAHDYTQYFARIQNTKFSNLKDFSDHMSLKISTEKMLSLTNYIEFNPKHFGYTI